MVNTSLKITKYGNLKTSKLMAGKCVSFINLNIYRYQFFLNWSVDMILIKILVK